MIPENLLACALKRAIVKEFASIIVVKSLLELHFTKVDAIFWEFFSTEKMSIVAAS
jgi:hypothetical protein